MLCRLERGKAALEIGDQIFDRLKPDMETHGRTAGLPGCRGAKGGAVERNGQAFVTAPGGADAEQFEGVDEGMICLLAAPA